MSHSAYAKIRSNPKFNQLVAQRSRLAWGLSLTVLGIYYAFTMVVAFSPATLGTPISAGATLSIGIPIGASMLIFFWILTAFYVKKANGEFDRLNQEIIEETTGGAKK